MLKPFHIKLICLSFTFLFFKIANAQTESSPAIPFCKKIKVIDSLSVANDKSPSIVPSAIRGNSLLRGEFSGMVYVDITTSEIKKIELVFDSSGNRQTLYCFEGIILKYKTKNNNCYFLNGRYYDDQCRLQNAASIVNDLTDSDKILKDITLLFNSK